MIERSVYAVDAIRDPLAGAAGRPDPWKHGKDTYFFERSNKEHDDGAITGSVHKFVDYNGEKRCRKAGAFRIDGEGRVVRFPTMPSNVRMNYTMKDRKTYIDRHGNPGGA